MIRSSGEPRETPRMGLFMGAEAGREEPASGSGTFSGPAVSGCWSLAGPEGRRVGLAPGTGKGSPIEKGFLW